MQWNATLVASACVLLALTGCAGSQSGRKHEELTRLYAQEKEARVSPEEPAFTLFGADSVLEPSRLVQEVLSRNQSVEAARQAWRGAMAAYRQSTSLEDPVVSYQIAPKSIGSDVPFGNEIEVRQMLPFPGKRGVKGASAIADAEMAYADYETMRLDLALEAAKLVYEAYRVERAIRINRDHMSFLNEIREVAASRYGVGQASQEEPLEAEVEISHLDHQRIELQRERLVIQDEMNTLLHREPNAPLPPPPSTLPRPDSLAMHVPTLYSPALMDTALARRPELKGALASIRGREAEKSMAGKESLPDFGLMGSYNSMWMDPEHQWMVGVEMNLPLWFGKQSAARDQAGAELEKARSEARVKRDAIRLEVLRALARMGEMVHSLALYDGHLLPASRDRVQAARAAFETGSMPALTLIMAERNLLDVELGYEEAMVQYHMYRLDLDRALGRIPGLEGSEP